MDHAREIKSKTEKEQPPAVAGFPVLISWKTAAIPTFGRDDDDCGDSELKSDAGGGGGGAGPLDLGAFAGAGTVVFPVTLQTGPKG